MAKIKSFRIDDILGNNNESNVITVESKVLSPLREPVDLSHPFAARQKVLTYSSMPVMDNGHFFYKLPSCCQLSDYGHAVIGVPLFQMGRRHEPRGKSLSSTMTSSSISGESLSTPETPTSQLDFSTAVEDESNDDVIKESIMQAPTEAVEPALNTCYKPSATNIPSCSVFHFPKSSHQPHEKMRNFYEASSLTAFAHQRPEPIKYPLFHPWERPRNYSRRRGIQIRFTYEQIKALEDCFMGKKYLTASDRQSLSRKLGLTERQVKTWFQNRRAKWRRLNEKTNSSDC